MYTRGGRSAGLAPAAPVVARTVAVGALVLALGLGAACGAVASPPSYPDQPGADSGIASSPATTTEPAAASSPSTSASARDTGPGVAACSLVTGQEAAQALGVGVVTVTSASAQDCSYQAGGDSVTIAYTIDANRSQADLLIASGGQIIPGVGDVAVQVTHPPTTQVHVWIGSKHLQITVVKQSGDSAAPARGLLDAAMARL
jgi:hypothetical protein